VCAYCARNPEPWPWGTVDHIEPLGNGGANAMTNLSGCCEACNQEKGTRSLLLGVNAHALCIYMGHSGIQVTIDLYGHLFPGNEAEASALLDTHLERAFAAAAGPKASDVGLGAMNAGADPNDELALCNVA
jgi:hypothetical protein